MRRAAKMARWRYSASAPLCSSRSCATDSQATVARRRYSSGGFEVALGVGGGEAALFKCAGERRSSLASTGQFADRLAGDIGRLHGAHLRGEGRFPAHGEIVGWLRFARDGGDAGGGLGGHGRAHAECGALRRRSGLRCWGSGRYGGYLARGGGGRGGWARGEGGEVDLAGVADLQEGRGGLGEGGRLHVREGWKRRIEARW